MMKILTLLFFMAAPALAAADCKVSKAIEFDRSADGLRRLSLDVGAGALTIVGAPNSDVVQVRGRACAGSRDELDNMSLRHERRSDELRLRSDVDTDRHWLISMLGWGYGSRYIDIELTVPAGLMLDIDDGSGPINIHDVTGDLRIDDGSGDIVMDSVDGNVVIDDGSGGIDVHRVTGRVEIEDGSGSIMIFDTGPVQVDDGSGDISIREINGDVLIVDDGSGPIDIQSIRGSVTIEDDGSGNIIVRDITGDFIAGDTGSGSVEYSAIDGDVRVRD